MERREFGGFIIIVIFLKIGESLYVYSLEYSGKKPEMIRKRFVRTTPLTRPERIGS